MTSDTQNVNRIDRSPNTIIMSNCSNNAKYNTGKKWAWMHSIILLKEGQERKQSVNLYMNSIWNEDGMEHKD